MAFTSIAFLVFAPIFFTLYYFISPKYRLGLVALFSLIFYAYWDVKYVPLIFASAIIDYVCSLRIHDSDDQKVRRFWLFMSLGVNLGILFFFKYWNFFAENVQALGINASFIDVLLPLGISFYTLQTLSYTFDVYRRKFVPEKNFGIYFTYVSFFPQLVAGPIERPSTLLPQIRTIGFPSAEDVHQGTLLIALGFFAKLVIADNIAGFISYAYFDSEGGLVLWPVAYLSFVQVYGDFFGYTLIARGLALYMGVRLSLNFRQPFFAKNITAFWQRWHISLTKWITDYIHIPLAKKFPNEPMRSVLVIMAMCIVGLWHGAAWNFVLFGFLNGFFMRIWNPIASVCARISGNKLVRNIFSRVALFFALSIVTPFFFIRDMDQLFAQVGSMFSTDLGLDIIRYGDGKVDFMIGMCALALFFINDALIYNKSKYHVESLAENKYFRTGIILFLMCAIFLLGNFNNQAFIYFEF